ncbi:GLPGLI family protein [Porphyromonas levii]|uniref:GLPGLI family protein n=1 Tax=Porphyromonas levii TaxID=28114 RepID=UPI001B8C32ED|nr:GLPGLI family protein [Porphyromonas levii]MBR8702839.1 hypothetical protein [Porphyromonas levii]MBR8731197.1 hypothetical protein [Porphyromonas levii]MBR8763306.1 hypothetical protein [Porphyromonas levii]MBR8784132.1 hypothetical protein [Porphyromonas levii]
MSKHKLLILFALIVIGLPLSAQSYKAMYEEKEVNLHDREVTSDLFMLEISKKGTSLFQSYYTLQQDSIGRACRDAGMSLQERIAQMRTVPPGSRNILFYNPMEMKYTELDYGYYYFKTVEDIKAPDYAFEDSTKLVAGYTSEMATAHIYGRDWVIYYTTEIPLPYGPWKINGLPGLVTEAYSIDGAYKFTLTGFEVLDEDVNIEIPLKMLNQPVQEVSRNELMWIRKQIACKDPRPIIKKYGKNYDMSGIYHNKIDRMYRELSKRYQYIEQ